MKQINTITVPWLKGNLIKESIVDFLIILFALVFSIISFLHNNVKTELFSRSGAILVLCGALLEYRHNKFAQNALYTSIDWSSGIGPSHIFELAWHKQITKIIAHLLIIIGTIIWGYSDLLTEKIF